jgi:hypothetical protein
MKPKNRIYCRECGKSKLLFESEKKALNFIKFNGDEILGESGRAPIRAYYCQCCGGYHVTSREVTNKRYNRTTQVIRAYKKEKGKI